MRLKHILGRCMRVGTASAVALALAMGPVSAEVWKMQTLWTAGSPNQKIVEAFAARVKQTTAGKVEINVFPVGSVVPFTETLEAVGRGILQAQHTGSLYFSGSEPAMALIGDMNGAYENPNQATDWFYHGGGLELARETYRKFGLFYVGPVFWGMGTISTKRRLDRVEDFSGLKMRVVQGMGSDLMSRLGASTVTMPGSEVFSALDKGVIDATQWGTLSMNEQLGLHKIAGFELHPGFYSMPGADVAVNLEIWNALAPETRAQVEMAVRNLNRDMIAQFQLADIAVANGAEKSGLTIVNWPPEERLKFRDAASKVWLDWSSRSEVAKRVYDSHIAFLTKLGLLR